MRARPVFEIPRERAGVITPGLPVLPRGTERHPVPGGGSRAVPICRGDAVSVVDREGLQPAELVFFRHDGVSDAAMLGARDHGRPDGTIAVLAGGSRSGAAVSRALGRAGFDLDRAQAIRVFGDGSRPGEAATFQAECDGLLIVAAPGGPMAPEAQDAPTDLVLYVHRARPAMAKGGLAPPDPLADPLADINIRPGDAKSYRVRKGEYIQVLDVQGRECSDFQAFALRDLDRGLERDIDPTTTRALMGAAYPMPGLHSKYWTVDQQPLLEVVQDTCGRHDTFGLACTARYYEELGYPGHVNCSDNINAELARYGIRPRAGWPAVNFFFNTMLDATNAIRIDEPWSRPGDYVLLRALDDLVCISTACPSDIDAANGWNPTDIQVRTYGATETFRRSIGHRKSAESELEQTKQTGFHACFSRHTRDFVDFNGFWLPHTITGQGPRAEYWACREKAAIMDLSALRKYEVTGPDAERLLQVCLTRDVSRLAAGQLVYSAICFEHGGMIDDGTLFRLGENNFRWVGGSDRSGLWLREQAEKLGLDAWVRSSTDQLHNVAVQGPLSREILADILWTAPDRPAVDELGLFRFTPARLGGFDGTSLVLARAGYTGELGYEVFCHPKDAGEVFDAIWRAGAPRGLAPLGLAALDMLRIEAGLVFSGAEFDDRTDPFEAGIGFAVPLKSKTADFIGRAALEARKAHPRRCPVGLEVESGVVPSHGDCLYLGKARIGEITSAVKSPTLGRVIALARVDVAHAEPGSEIEIGQLDGQQKRLKARIVPFPHFDPAKERMKGNYG